MLKITLVIWILWICWAMIQGTNENGIVWALLSIISIITGLAGIIWILFFCKFNMEQSWPLTLTETIVAFLSFSVRPICLIIGLILLAREYGHCFSQAKTVVKAETKTEKWNTSTLVDMTEAWNAALKWEWAEREIKQAKSVFVFGFLSLIPRGFTLIPILLTMFFHQGFWFTIIFLFLYLILFFMWIFTAVGYGWTFSSISYGDSGYGDMGNFFNFAFVCGEALLPILIWITLLTEPIHSFLAPWISLHK